MASRKGLASAPAVSKLGWPAALMLGDGCMFLIFATVGWLSHGREHPLLWVWGTSGAPFAIGWFIVAPFFGVYRRSVTSGWRSTFWRTALAWICAWPVGWLLRWLFAGEAPASFAITTLIITMILLLFWRSLFAVVTKK